MLDASLDPATILYGSGAVKRIPRVTYRHIGGGKMLRIGDEADLPISFQTLDPTICDYGEALQRRVIHSDGDRPAVRWSDEPGSRINFFGRRDWYRHGVLHRENGPAIEGGLSDYPDRFAYYLNGERVTRQDVDALSETDGR